MMTPYTTTPFRHQHDKTRVYFIKQCQVDELTKNSLDFSLPRGLPFVDRVLYYCNGGGFVMVNTIETDVQQDRYHQYYIIEG